MTARPSLLIVEDSPQIRAEIRRVLEAAVPGIEVFEAETGIDALKTLTQKQCDVVLCDVQMPQMDGFQFLRVFRARPENMGVPVIMLTSRDNADEKIFGLEAGATDYVTKPFVAGELVARVKGQLKLKALQDELKEKNDQLQELSATDFLTKAFNRRYFATVLDTEFKRAQRYKVHLSLAILDIDHFKLVNDKYGHTTGDAVLADFAAILKGSFRSSDVLARYGGEEFVLLMPHTGVPAACTAVEKVRLALQSAQLGSLEKGAITFSGGVAMYPSETVDSTDTLVKRADQALYRAKESGRNKIIIDEL